MTRWARIGNHQQKKLAHDATSWNELSKNIKKNHKAAGVKVANSTQDPQQAALALAAKKDKRREHRRIKRQRKKQEAKVCFHCRMKGHGMADCPLYKEEDKQSICFKCGNAGHSSRECKVKGVPKGKLPFATCFICKKQGHQARECPENPNALYMDGKSCQLCGSVEHYKRDCPERKVKDEVRVYKRTSGFQISMDEELSLYEDIDEKKEEEKRKQEELKKKKKKKIVITF